MDKERYGAEPETELTAVLNSFRRLLRALRVAAVETQTRYQVSPAQLFVLDELNDAGRALSINELAQRTMTDRSSVADVVERLVQNGHATRERSADDRRRAEVRITESGKTLAQSAPPAPGIRLANGLRQLSQEELTALSIGMRGLLLHMGLADGTAGFMFEDDRSTLSDERGSIPTSTN